LTERALREQDERQRRLALAMRANLRRRKEQARGQQAGTTVPVEAGADDR
jgi:hypothetical protein